VLTILESQRARDWFQCSTFSLRGGVAATQGRLYIQLNIIIGSGPAGYTAAVYAARAMLEPGIVSGMQPGGQLTITTDVENYPGFPEIMGPDLMDKFKEHALKFGTAFHEDTITDVDFSGKPFVMKGESGKTYTADSVIIATGAQAKWLGLPSEDKFQGFGVSACATCDGFFYRDREVVVVGGGNTAVEEALFLTNFASRVTLVHRRDSLRAEKILQKRLFDNPKVEILWDTTLEEILGDEQPLGVTGVRLKVFLPQAMSLMSYSGKPLQRRVLAAWAH